MGLFIHLGAHKTASTHLVECINRVESALLKSNLMFLGPKMLRRAPLNLRVLMNDPEAREKRQAVAGNVLRGLLAESRDLILSEEQILGALDEGKLLGRDGSVYPQAGLRLNHLLDLLGTRDATLALAIRSPADFLTSAFGEQLRHGGPLRIDAYLNGYLPSRLRWSELVERLRRESGVTRMICWRYEDLAGIRRDLLGLMLGPELAAIVPDLPPTRVGLSDAAYRMLLAGSEGDSVNVELGGQARLAYPKQNAGDRLQVLPQEVHKECDRLYAEDCARIAAMPDVRFLVPRVVQG